MPKACIMSRYRLTIEKTSAEKFKCRQESECETLKPIQCDAQLKLKVDTMVELFQFTRSLFHD